MYFSPRNLLVPTSLLSSAFSATTRHAPRSDLSSRVIHQFPNPTWLENIVITSSDKILVTDITNPYLYYIDPTISSPAPDSNETATLIHSFTPELSLLGITEVAPSHFYLITRNFTLSSVASTLTGVNTIYSVDLTSYVPSTNSGASVSKVAVISGAGSLNGLTTLSESQNLIIAADPILGVVWSINVLTSEYSVLLDLAELKPPVSTSLAFGVNGLKVLTPTTGDTDQVYIYYTNTGLTTFGRIPFSLSTLNVTGPVEILTDAYGADDFALDSEQGVAYLAYGTGASVLKIGLEGGDVSVVIGGVNDTLAGNANETVLSGPTSVQLGRAGDGLGWAYVSQSGKNEGVYTEGGKVLAIDITDSS
ncbi:uncharacterized protein EAE98_006288 [Botrytis deweyae]|uniref:SMP-30/Gluconolactonase/LRE-like region domain-containing protein n=1 Tax=Botrytis deweyae TaxID=2478750 RepID=A0ABQ7IL94_9HELO|nr:uncharacterized protein EAE98_006288 [Botrytis deweyae]KAF7926904.1 hypothetical protein EAE98_006288 [Botrytis deweyae]